MHSRQRLTTTFAAAIGTAAILLCASCNSTESTRRQTQNKNAAREETQAARMLPTPVAFDDVNVPEGSAYNLGFTLAFRVRRIPGDEGKTYQQAAAACRETGRMLCTEVQWLRACEQHESLGQMESWTATVRGKNAVVAGGEGCRSRERVSVRDVHPNRVGLCCERAVVLKPPDAGPWLGPGTRLPARFERALNEGNDKELRNVLAEPVVRDGRKWSADELIAQEKSVRTRVGWTLFDTCEIRVGPVVVDKSDAEATRVQGKLLTCKTVLNTNDDVLEYVTLFGLVEGDYEDSLRIAQIDHRGPAIIPGAR
jgi:hypothetical protein